MNQGSWRNDAFCQKQCMSQRATKMKSEEAWASLMSHLQGHLVAEDRGGSTTDGVS
jgi:hypothetical protein